MVTQKSNNVLEPGQGRSEFIEVFAIYRVDQVMGGRVIAGRLLPSLRPDSLQVRDFLDRWPGSHSMRSSTHGWDLLLFEPSEQRERWWLHAALFLLTLFSTTVAGSLLSGLWPIEFFALPAFFPGAGGWWLPVPIAIDLPALAVGAPFGLALVLVLALHEAGHYYAARLHSLSVTPPFFIPFPPYISIIGTLGAFIRLRSPVTSRNALLDVGVAGPVLSFVASLPLLWWGLLNSRVVSVEVAHPSPYLVQFAGVEQFWLGGSVAMSGLVRLVLDVSGPGQYLDLHPVAFAGWLGLFVTALNLLPISQLDGGHILYAMLGGRQRPVAWLFFSALIPLGFLWAGWWIWAVLIFVIGRGRMWHPPVFNAERGLTAGRLAVGIVAAIVFVLCFVPVPFRL
jgi:hypothetical protein